MGIVENKIGCVLIKVTVEVSYYVPMHDQNISKVNGWTPDEIVQDWFIDNNINRHHCTRDRSELGGSKVIKSIEIEKHFNENSGSTSS